MLINLHLQNSILKVGILWYIVSFMRPEILYHLLFTLWKHVNKRNVKDHGLSWDWLSLPWSSARVIIWIVLVTSLRIIYVEPWSIYQLSLVNMDIVGLLMPNLIDILILKRIKRYFHSYPRINSSLFSIHSPSMPWPSASKTYLWEINKNGLSVFK